MTSPADPGCGHGTHAPHTHPPRRPDGVVAVAARAASALGDPARLRLLELLFDGRHCVTELAEEAGGSMSTVSQRLKALVDGRLVTRTREGRHVYYALADDHVRALIEQLFAHSAE